MPKITLNGETFELATNLRVAFKIQGQHNHKPYSEVFSSVGKMPLEQQVNILYAAFAIANPNERITNKEFLEMVLDEYGLAQILNLITDIVEGIMFKGMTEEEIEEHVKKQEEAVGKMKASH